MNITELLAFSVKNDASDLHISAGLPPMIRVDGDLRRLALDPLSHEQVTELLYEIMRDHQRKAFEEFDECDFAIDVSELSRFRVNAFKQERGASGVFRTIPNDIKSLDTLGMPHTLKELALLPRGLVLVTGPTGSGKSTTLAAMIDHVNDTKNHHILTIEDPIEFVHQSKSALINQRELGRDTQSFQNALKAALREDPDIILVGEMRDIDTIRLALTAAETGHLVFATLHTTSATKTINRIIDVFPAGEKAMVRSMLSESLQAVITQTLIKKNGGGRTPALEIMKCTGAIRNLIREDKVAQMYSALQTGRAQGMQTLDQHLLDLVENHQISRQAAYEIAENKDMFR